MNIIHQIEFKRKYSVLDVYILRIRREFDTVTVTELKTIFRLFSKSIEALIVDHFSLSWQDMRGLPQVMETYFGVAANHIGLVKLDLSNFMDEGRTFNNFISVGRNLTSLKLSSLELPVFCLDYNNEPEFANRLLPKLQNVILKNYWQLNNSHIVLNIIQICPNLDLFHYHQSDESANDIDLIIRNLNFVQNLTTLKLDLNGRSVTEVLQIKFENGFVNGNAFEILSVLSSVKEIHLKNVYDVDFYFQLVAD